MGDPADGEHRADADELAAHEQSVPISASLMPRSRSHTGQKLMKAPAAKK